MEHTHPLFSQTKTYLANFDCLDNVRGFVGQAAQQCGFEAGEVYEVQLAVDEAFTNIIEHSMGGECHEQIQCTCIINKADLTIILRDDGRPFDPSTVPPPDLQASLEDRQAGGLGLYLMRNLMDEVQYCFELDPASGEHYNTLTLVKCKEK